jgi:hypothetical protein
VLFIIFSLSQCWSIKSRVLSNPYLLAIQPKAKGGLIWEIEY